MRFVFCCWPVTEGLHDHAKAMITRCFYNQDPGCLVMQCYLKQILSPSRNESCERASDTASRCGKGMYGRRSPEQVGYAFAVMSESTGL